MRTGVHKSANRNWRIPDHGENWFREDGILGVLMDIREELRLIADTLACPTFRGIPTTLRAINRKTRTPK